MYTSPQRREIYTENGGIEPFIPTMSWGYLEETEDGKNIQNILVELQNENSDFINWFKNHQIIKLFLESKNCNWLWNGSFEIPKGYVDPNRFDGDYFTQPLIDFGSEGKHVHIPIMNWGLEEIQSIKKDSRLCQSDVQIQRGSV
jgi:hypothetical protein